MPRWIARFLSLPPGAVFFSGAFGPCLLMLDPDVSTVVNVWYIVAGAFFGPLIAWTLGHAWAQRRGVIIEPRWGGDEER